MSARKMCWISLSVLFCVVALFSTSVRAFGDEALVRMAEDSLRMQTERLKQLQGEAAMAPAGLAEQWKQRLAVHKKMVELQEAAVKAAKADNAAGFEAAATAVGKWNSWDNCLEQWLQQESEVVRLRAQPEPEDAREKELHRRVIAGHEEASKVYSAAAARAGQEPPAEIEKVTTEAYEKLRVVGTVQELLGALTERRNIATRQKDDGEEKLRPLYLERLDLQDKLIALLDKRVAAAGKPEDEAANKLQAEMTKLYQKINLWEQGLERRRGELADERELTDAPESLKPLIRERMALSKELADLRPELEKANSEERRRQLALRSQLLEIRIQCLREIADVRRESAELLKEAAENKDAKDDARVKNLAASMKLITDGVEKQMRESAKLQESIAELQARSELQQQLAQRLREHLGQVTQKLTEAVEAVKDGGDPGPADAEQAREESDRLADELRQFDKTHAELRKTAQVQVNLVRAVLEDAGKCAAAGLKQFEAGKAAAAKAEFAACRWLQGTYEQVQQLLQSREELEELAAEAKDLAGNKVASEALAAYRKAADEATRAEIEAQKAVFAGDPNLLPLMEKAAAALGEVEGAGAALRTMLDEQGGEDGRAVPMRPFAPGVPMPAPGAGVAPAPVPVPEIAPMPAPAP